MMVLRRTATRAALTVFFLTALSGPAHSAPRLISTDAGTTALLNALGAAPLIVGIDSTSAPQLPDRPNVGYHRQLSAEGMLRLAPTLVIGSDQMGPDSALAVLQRAGVAVLPLPTAYTRDDLLRNLDSVAATLSLREAAAPLRQRITLAPRSQGHANRTVFLLARGATLKMAGHRTGGQALLDGLGLVNCAAWEGYRLTSGEALLAFDPALILLAGEPDDADAIGQLIAAQPLLAHARAYRQQRILVVDSRALVAGLSVLTLAEAERLRPHVMQANTSP